MNNQIQLVLKSSTAEMPLNDQALGIYLTPELDGLVGLPEIRTTSGVNAGYDGGWTSAQNYDARSITIRGVIANENVATVERLRKQLVSLAGQGKSEELTLDLVTEAGNAYTLQVRTIALEMSMQSVLTQQQFMLQLRADDPLIYDAGESEHEATLQVAQATGGFTIDFELPLAITGGSEESVVNNDGLEEVPTIVKMYGALHNPKIINQTNNEQMQIMADLGYAEGAWHTPSEASEGTNISLTNTPDSAPFSEIQLKGDTAQNGTPTPSAPVAVQTVTGENVVKICGKNLFATPASATINGITFTLNSDGTYNISGTSTARAQIIRYIDASLLENGATYTAKANKPLGNVIARIESNSAINTYLRTNYMLNSSTQQQTAVLDGSGAALFVMVIRVESGKTVNISGLGIQLEKGQATDFEPYQEQSYEVNLASKNLCDGSIYKTDYVISPTGAENASAGAVITTSIQVEPNTTYTASVNWGASSPDKYMRVGIYTSNMTFISRPSSSAAGSAITFTTPANARYVRLCYFTPATNAQLELGNQATDYEAFWNVELCKIDTYQDYIYKSGGKWYKHKEVGIADLSKDVNTADTYHISGRGYAIRVTSGTPQKTTSGSETMRGFCDRLTLSSRDAIYATGSQNSISVGDPSTDYWKDFFLDPDGTNGMSAADFNTWLSNNPIKVYYILAASSEIEVTNEALIAQLDDLLNLSRTYQGQTNLADLAASGNMPAILNVSYFTEQDPDTRDELIIDSRLHTVTLNGLDIYHLIGEGSEFLMLEPGENRLSLQSDITGDNGYAVVSYKQGYLSI